MHLLTWDVWMGFEVEHSRAFAPLACDAYALHLIESSAREAGHCQSDAAYLAEHALADLKRCGEAFIQAPEGDAGVKYESLTDDEAAKTRTHACTYECEHGSADPDTVHYIGEKPRSLEIWSFERSHAIAAEERAADVLGRSGLANLKRECWEDHQPSKAALEYAAEQRSEGTDERYIHTPPATVDRPEDVRVVALRETDPERFTGHTLELWLAYGADGQASATYGIGNGAPSIYAD